MLNLSDKELDQLSREAAEQFEPDEDVSSWEKLEQQLDGWDEDKPPVSSPMSKAPLGYGALLLLLVGASYFLLKSGNDNTHSTLKNQVSKETNQQSGKQNTSDRKDNIQKQTTNAQNKDQAVPSATNDAAGESVLPSEDATVDKNDHAGLTEKAADKSPNSGLTDQKKSGSENSIAKNRTATGPDNNIGDNNNSLTKAGVIGTAGIKNKNTQGKNNHKNKGQQNLKDEIVSEPADANSGAAPLLTQGKSQGKNNIPAADASDKSKYAVLPGLVLVDNAGADISDSSLLRVAANTNSNTPAPKNQALHINRSLKIGFMIAPDVTKVGSASSSKLSPNIGITIGYSFSSRWSINTGIIYTKKNYASYGGDFHWSYPYPNRVIDYADGSCNMWEIPLSLRYDFPSITKNNFFINSGLSSYLMKHESYTVSSHYWSPQYGTVYIKQPLTVDSHSKYLFSVFSLSAGIEHQFNKNFSLQVEPFIKIPLTGVGIGSLQLNSYGLSFSLRYAPLLNKSRH